MKRFMINTYLPSEFFLQINFKTEKSKKVIIFYFFEKITIAICYDMTCEAITALDSKKSITCVP